MHAELAAGGRSAGLVYAADAEFVVEPGHLLAEAWAGYSLQSFDKEIAPDLDRQRL
jgi:hypothetical protein